MLRKKRNKHDRSSEKSYSYLLKCVSEHTSRVVLGGSLGRRARRARSLESTSARGSGVRILERPPRDQTFGRAFFQWLFPVNSCGQKNQSHPSVNLWLFQHQLVVNFTKWKHFFCACVCSHWFRMPFVTCCSRTPNVEPIPLIAFSSLVALVKSHTNARYFTPFTPFSSRRYSNINDLLARFFVPAAAATRGERKRATAWTHFGQAVAAVCD